jgi:hypothetical protein
MFWFKLCGQGMSQVTNLGYFNRDGAEVPRIRLRSPFAPVNFFPGIIRDVVFRAMCHIVHKKILHLPQSL